YMISAHFGHFLDKPLESVARFVKISPNAITITGFFITIVAGCTLPYHLLLGAFLILFGGVFDLLDGAVARINGKESDFGAFLDSVLDRYSDAILFIGFVGYFLRQEHISFIGVFLTLGTMVGTLVISYAKARAESLGKDCHVGIMERAERIILMVFGALTGWLVPVMAFMFVFTHITVLQRIYHVWKIMKKG
ncbi:MAG: CDP-alcohol phosphatidyltransferase family protein, partial [Nitrospirae bacterium]